MVRRMVGQGRVTDHFPALTRRDMIMVMVLGSCASFALGACKPAPPITAPYTKTVPPKPAVQRPDTLTELTKLGSDIRLDIRYATTRNFTGVQLYDEPRAFLVHAAAQALIRAHMAAQADGYGLLIHDAYRPWRVTKKLWDMTPPDKRGFVANPKQGSRHNRGCAVDLTLYDRATGNAVRMPSGYDEFSRRAYRSYDGGSADETANRARLERYMEAEGFIGISNEWWHFDYKDWANFPILDVPFAKI
jgi:zinc D-Ala-D-Ala dipeptidase